MYLSPFARPQPIPDTRPNRWRVRADIPFIERAGESCRLLSHRVDRGQLFFAVRFNDGEVLEYLPGDLECERVRG